MKQKVPMICNIVSLILLIVFVIKSMEEIPCWHMK